MQSREEFQGQVTQAKTVAVREGRLLALVAVPLGLGQLAYIKWADANLGGARPAIIGPIFLGYMALVVLMLMRYRRRTRATRPRCPSCGAPLEEMSQRVALATGRCDQCGDEVSRESREVEVLSSKFPR
jgi:predicted RNA-binding Zn-ribbon protein involved in translation (DUF1610 family)